MSAKTFLAATIVACAVLTPNGADAQSRKFFGMVAVGPAVPVGEFSDEFSVGFSSVGYSYSSNYGGFGESGGDYSERDNGLMVGAGGGVQMQGDRVGFFAEGRLAAIPGSGHSHAPILVGVRIGGR